LLGRDLKPYLRPYAWQRLNAAEKALLGNALPEARKRIARELSLRWELEAPSPDAETMLFTQTLRGSDLALQDSLGLARNKLWEDYSSGTAFIRNKLNSIIIPRIDFEDTTVEEAIDFLRIRAAELDTLELDPSRKGISFVVRRPRYSSNDNSHEAAALGGGDPGMFRIKELRLKNVPLGMALKYICDATKLRYKVDDYAVTLVPQTETGEDIFTRTFQVPPDFAEALSGGGDPNSDPFAEPQDRPVSNQARKPIVELLKNAGIPFSEGSSATLTANGILLVTNNPTALDMVEALTMTISSNAPGPGRKAEAWGFESDGEDGGVLSPLGDHGLDPSAVDPFAATDPFAAPRGNRLAARPPAPTLFPDRTKVWLEANYYHNTAPTDESLIPLNRFWLDLAAWDGEGAFLSPHFNACATTANEALMCLAVLDLPFKAERPEVSVDGSTLRVKAREPMVLFYKDTRRSDKVAQESPLLLRQSFSPLAEKFRTVDGHQVENPVTGDFRPGVPYTASLVVTNPTGIGRRIDLLAQIPAGSIPLEGKPATLSSTVEIEPHGVLMLELAFYFPAAGDFAVYPLHVSEDGTVLAHTGPRTLRVSNDPEKQDAASWLVLARDGSNDEVLSRLLTENLDAINLGAIRWRLQDKAFFLKVSEILRDRLHFSPEIAAYGFHHNDPETIRTWLENSRAVRQLGQWLDSPLLDVRPRVHHDWQTLEFDPLVNPRSHHFGENPRMTHQQAREHYQALLDQLAWKPALDAADQLTLCAYLFLQDRIEEALERFAKIDSKQVPGQANYDYLHAVALFYQEKPDEAKAIATAALPKLPPGLWADRFQAVIDQADEVAALSKPAESEKPAEEVVVSHLDIALSDGGKLAIQHRGLDKATLRLFSVDLEVLFSKDPFLQGEGGNNAQPAIRPNEILEVALAKDVSETTIELPESLRNRNVLVSAESGNTKLLKVLDSRALDLRHLPLERTVQVLDAATHKPLVKSYVKVFAENRNGEVVFHKDGYTDLRGKFDYLSHTGEDVSKIKRVALLVSHSEKGARTVIYDR
jgi:tetratricopeptide (TPR) repeat protein